MTKITIETAKEYHAAGLSILPASKAQKRPTIGKWKAYSSRSPTINELEAWFANNHDGLCIIAGAVSGNLECIDFDFKAELFDTWCKKVNKTLLKTLVIERTQSGGKHVVYRCVDAVAGNQKLAQGTRSGKLVTLIETRGEGGLFLCAPSDGYTLEQNDFTQIPTLTAQERESLLNAARELNEAQQAGNLQSFVVAPTSIVSSMRPGDDYCQRGDLRALLLKWGWTSLGVKSDSNEHWVRPGKQPDAGLSATLKDGVFYVFSTNAAPFESDHAYNAFQVYTLLEHNGDFTSAARQLLADGYGQTDAFFAPPTTYDEEPKPLAYDDPGTMSDELLSVPGFVNELMNYTLRTAYYPNKVLAFAGALTMLSHLTARRFKDVHGSRFNLYLLALAKSGTGKEHPRAVNIDLATQMGFASEMGDVFASGEGLEDSLCVSPAMLYQVDEIDYLFNTMKLKDVRAEQINAILLKLYSESRTTHIMRKKALQRGQPKTNTVIVQPHLTMFGTATPKYFYQSLNERTMENGLLARCIVLEAGERGAAGSPHEESFPDTIMDVVRYFVRIGHEHNLTGEFPNPIVVQVQPDAELRLKEIFTAADEEYANASKAGDDSANALWARAGEKVSKLAALYAISANPYEPIITHAAVNWAWRFVQHITQRMLYMAELYVTNSEYDAQAMKILRIVKQKQGHISHRLLLRNSHLDKDSFKRVVETLIESGTLRREYGPQGGVIYVMENCC